MTLPASRLSTAPAAVVVATVVLLEVWAAQMPVMAAVQTMAIRAPMVWLGRVAAVALSLVTRLCRWRRIVS